MCIRFLHACLRTSASIGRKQAPLPAKSHTYVALQARHKGLTGVCVGSLKPDCLACLKQQLCTEFVLLDEATLDLPEGRSHLVTHRTATGCGWDHGFRSVSMKSSHVSPCKSRILAGPPLARPSLALISTQKSARLSHPHSPPFGSSPSPGSFSLIIPTGPPSVRD